MSTTPPDSAVTSRASDDAGRRRRRRRSEEPSSSPPRPRRGVPSPSRRTTPRSNLVPASWGLTPTFRVFLFLGAIVAVMAFLLYNEYLIRQFREQERDRAELYANLYGLAVSEAVPAGPAGEIFHKIIMNPSISLPLIVADYRGTILMAKGPGLPEADGSQESQRRLVEAMRKMDAVNEPVRARWTSQARGRAFVTDSLTIVTDPTGYPVAWAGAALPSLDDSLKIIEVLGDLQQRLVASGVPAHEFSAQAEATCYLAQSGSEFVIIEMGNQRPLAWDGAGLPARADTSLEAAVTVRARYEEFAARREPVTFQLHNEHVIHFGDTDLLSRISLAPLVTLGVLCLFGLIGYVGFRNMRRSEQRSIWVGMAKETAHQLGTPLSSLSGWLELMQQRLEALHGTAGAHEAEAVATIAAEMQRDMGRLNQIASRFSQIGSVPELRPGDLTDVINDTISYFRGRGPQFGRHTFEVELDPLPTIPLNAELMGWVFENLFKNAMDAMTGQEGVIRVSSRHDAGNDEILIVIEDNGRGIKAEHLPRVFEPGFSTKKRGWGLGLAFVKRIIEEYHCGRIQVMQSERGEGASFEITLPTG